MNMKKWKIYSAWILFAEAVGALSGWLTRHGMEVYKVEVLKPPLSPPEIVFPVVWTILYALMGVGAARVFMTPPSTARSQGLRLFLIQLAFNFLWTILFFNLQHYGLAFLWLAVLWVLILLMTRAFQLSDRTAARLQIPYLLWVAFAGYLNLGVFLLNRA